MTDIHTVLEKSEWFGALTSEHTFHWCDASALRRRLPLMVKMNYGHDVPNLIDEMVDWINENIKHPFALVSVGDQETKYVTAKLARFGSQTDLEGIGQLLSPEDDDHIRFSNFNDYLLFKLRWT